MDHHWVEGNLYLVRIFKKKDNEDLNIYLLSTQGDLHSLQRIDRIRRDDQLPMFLVRPGDP